MTLKERLADWTDCDVACYYVAVALGIATDPGDDWDYWGGKKRLFWTNNPLGNSMYYTLDKLVQGGVLEENDNQYRWNPEFGWDEL